MSASNSDLPSSRAFITQLLDSLHALPPPSVGSTNNAASIHLTSAPEAVKKQLLTLHVLFPNEFLPALDLLDRHLVTRFHIRRKPAVAPTPQHGGIPAAQYAQPAAQPTITVNPTDQVEHDIAAREGIHAAQTEDDTRHEDRAMSARISSITAAAHIDPPDADADGDSTMLDVGAESGSGSAVPHLVDLKEEPHRPQFSYEADPGIDLEAAGEHGKGVEDETLQDLACVPHISDAAQTGNGAGQGSQMDSEIGDVDKDEDGDGDTVYYVRSAQQRSSRYSSSIDSTASYEVRLQAWNCSCSAFAFAAFPNVHPDPVVVEVEFGDALRGFLDTASNGAKSDQEDVWSFGGLGLGTGMPPVCKHLLACVLVERCPIFSSFVDEKDVGVEEAAGWAAGWGD